MIHTHIVPKRYLPCVTIRNLCVLLGQEKSVDVLNVELPQDHDDISKLKQEQLESTSVVDQISPVSRMKILSGTSASGLRIRSSPSFTVSCIACIIYIFRLHVQCVLYITLGKSFGCYQTW